MCQRHEGTVGDRGGQGARVASGVGGFCPSLEPSGKASDLLSQRRRRRKRGSTVTAGLAAALPSGDILLPGFAAADNVLGAHPADVAGDGRGR